MQRRRGGRSASEARQRSPGRSVTETDEVLEAEESHGECRRASECSLAKGGLATKLPGEAESDSR